MPFEPRLISDTPEQHAARVERIRARRAEQEKIGPPPLIGDIGWGDAVRALNITDTGLRRWFQRNPDIWIDRHPSKGDRLSFTWRDVARLKLTKLLVAFGFGVSEAFHLADATLARCVWPEWLDETTAPTAILSSLPGTKLLVIGSPQPDNARPFTILAPGSGGATDAGEESDYEATLRAALNEPAALHVNIHAAVAEAFGLLIERGHDVAESAGTLWGKGA